MEVDTGIELVARARGGDKEAFGRLVERLEPTARRIAVRMVGDREVASELVQEAALQAYLSLGRLRDDARFKGWLYGIVLNVCRSYIRGRRDEVFSLEEWLGGLPFEAIPFSASVDDPTAMAEDREVQRLVLDAVRVLPPKSREAALLFYYEQLSLQEIASRLELSVVAVKSRLHKARNQLRNSLLPAFPELAERPRAVSAGRSLRRGEMRRVVIADVVQREIDGNRSAVVVLLDEEARRALCIWVGAWEGMSIALNMRKVATERPMTYNFAASLLDAEGARLEEARIEGLQGDVFIGTVKVRTNGSTREVDARPSDAIALAAVTGSPIYVSEEVMERAGMEVPSAEGELPRFGRGMDRLVEEFGEIQGRMRAPRLGQVRSEVEKERERGEFWAFVLGQE